MAAHDESLRGERPRQEQEPEWARGLRDLYDKVVDEPLPPNFADLLEQLDKPQSGSSNK